MATKVFRSLIKKYFPIELLMELDKLTNNYELDNNHKNAEVERLLTEYNVPYEILGTGTNRTGVLIDGYAVKIALDRLGKMDNRREFKYTSKLQPYVVKVYESNKQGLIAVTEYITIFSIDDYYDRQTEMRAILKDISRNFLIGDIGITSNNYVNWGIRGDGSICILDFAYIYALSYKSFSCTCNDNALLEYDNDFVNLTCPVCGKKFTFGQIRRRITRKDEEAEVGDITELGYILKEVEEEHEIEPDKVIVELTSEEAEKEQREPTRLEKNREIIKQLKKKKKKDVDLYDLDPMDQLFMTYGK